MTETLVLDDSWLGGDGMNVDGVSVTVRYRPNLQNFVNSGLYNTRIDIDWLYDDTGDAFMPSIGEQTGMESFEEVLNSLFAEDNQSVLAFVYTSQGTRRWLWYTKNSNDAGERIKTVMPQYTDFEITLRRNEDPDWEEYFDFIRRYEEEAV